MDKIDYSVLTSNLYIIAGLVVLGRGYPLYSILVLATLGLIWTFIGFYLAYFKGKEVKYGKRTINN